MKACSFTPGQAEAVLAAAHHIDTHGPPLLQAVTDQLALALTAVRPDQRRTVALAAVEIALRDAPAMIPTTRSKAA